METVVLKEVMKDIQAKLFLVFQQFGRQTLPGCVIASPLV